MLISLAVDLPVIQPFGDETQLIGQTETIICIASDSESPDVDLMWSRIDMPLIENGRVQTGSAFSGQLQLQIEDFGTADVGVYQCTASNPDGGATVETVNLTITGKCTMEINLKNDFYYTVFNILLYRIAHDYRTSTH